MNIQILKVVIPQGFPQVFGYEYSNSESGDSQGFPLVFGYEYSNFESGDSPGFSPSVWV